MRPIGTAITGAAAAMVAAALVTPALTFLGTSTDARSADVRVVSHPVDESTSAERLRVSSPVLRRLDRRVRVAAGDVREFESVAARLDHWFGCVQLVQVDQLGDPEHQWGFLFDERDGTGLDTRTALVPHTGAGRPDLALLRLSRRVSCLSRAPVSTGTGDDARMVRAPVRTLRGLERALAGLEARIDDLEDAFDRFDEWESCLSWLPVTEYGDLSQDLGFLFDTIDGTGVHVPALDIDGSEWDDPDYEFLAFLGRDRPFVRRECGNEPGEGVDRPAPVRTRSLNPVGRTGTRDRLDDVRGDLATVLEDIEDLLEPAEEFVHFDECMFTVGVQEQGGIDHGYAFRTRRGALRYRTALSYDLSTLALPQMDLMAFPGEEPPQIECNEDAGGQDTDE